MPHRSGVHHLKAGNDYYEKITLKCCSSALSSFSSHKSAIMNVVFWQNKLYKFRVSENIYNDGHSHAQLCFITCCNSFCGIYHLFHIFHAKFNHL